MRVSGSLEFLVANLRGCSCCCAEISGLRNAPKVSPHKKVERFPHWPWPRSRWWSAPFNFWWSLHFLPILAKWTSGSGWFPLPCLARWSMGKFTQQRTMENSPCGSYGTIASLQPVIWFVWPSKMNLVIPTISGRTQQLILQNWPRALIVVAICCPITIKDPFCCPN